MTKELQLYISLMNWLEYASKTREQMLYIQKEISKLEQPFTKNGARKLWLDLCKNFGVETNDKG